MLLDTSDQTLEVGQAEQGFSAKRHLERRLDLVCQFHAH